MFQDGLPDAYTVERELGRGGMATVYLVRDAKHQRLVALKVLNADLAASLGPQRFRREIATAARLQHPHILGVYDSGETPTGQLWFTMPYVEGESRRAAYDMALRYAPSSAEANQGLTGAEAGMGDWPDALEHAKRVRQRQGHVVGHPFGSFDHLRGNTALARAHADTAIAIL